MNGGHAERLGLGSRRAAATCSVRAVLWVSIWKSSGRMTSHFSLLVKAKMQTSLLYSSNNILSSTWSKDVNSMRRAFIGSITRSGPVWREGMALWRNASSVTREAWLWTKDCSWPTLGLCSLPCFGASGLSAAWQGLPSAAALRHWARPGSGSSPGLEHHAQAAVLASAGLAAARCSRLNNIWLLMRHLTSELKASF